jgi:hypothetical protein
MRPGSLTCQDIEHVLVGPMMGTNHSRQSGGERVNVLDLSRWQFAAIVVGYLPFAPIATGFEFQLAGYEAAS